MKILIVLASSLMAGCGSGETSSTSQATTTAGVSDIVTTAAVKVIPDICQDTRTAFGEWSDADRAAAESVDNVIAHARDLVIQLGQGLPENLQQLIDDLNADVQTATEGADASGRLEAVYSPLMELCLQRWSEVPPACADEIGQYPEVIEARVQVGEAQTTLLNTLTAVRDAMIAFDEEARDAAIDQVPAADEQLNASRTNWNEVVVPPFNTAVEACNAAIA